MKKPLILLALLTLVLIFGAPAMACADHGAHAKIALKIMQDGDLIDISADDLEVGESRTFTSDSGKEVVLTRLEEGISLTIDGEEIDLGEAGAMTVDVQGDGEGHVVKRIIKKIECEHEGECEHHEMMMNHHGGEGHQMMFITKGDDEGGEHEVIVHDGGEGHGKMMFFGGEGDAQVIRMHRKSALEQLREDGVLDRLSDADRELVVQSLSKLDQGHEPMIVKVMGDGENIWVDKDGEVHELDVDVEIHEEN